MEVDDTARNCRHGVLQACTFSVNLFIETRRVTFVFLACGISG